MSKILVTGGSGFIGTNLIENLLLNGHEILNIDINKPKKEKLTIYWKKGDINFFDSFNDSVNSFLPEYIVHLAARTDLDGVSLDDYKTNILGVENLLKIANGLTSLKKIIITSSMLVCHGGYYPKDQFDFSPTTIYGESKVETEKIVWKNQPCCDWAIIRPTSIWGPWFGIPYKNFFDMIISRKYFHIGNKGCTKTYGYVGNSIFQIEKILFTETKQQEKKIFFIGDDPATNIEEWANEIADEIAVKIIKMPYLIIKSAAIFGDFLKFFGVVSFPMNSFRLNNMTTNNIVDLTNTYELAPTLPFTRKQGIINTIKWIGESEKNENINNNSLL